MPLLAIMLFAYTIQAAQEVEENFPAKLETFINNIKEGLNEGHDPENYQYGSYEVITSEKIFPIFMSPEGQKALLILQEMFEKLQKLNGKGSTLLLALNKKDRGIITSAHTKYVQLEKRLFQAIQKGDYDDFVILLDFIEKLPQLITMPAKDLNDEQFDSAVLEHLAALSRFIRFKEEIDKYHNYKLVAQYPKLARGIFFISPVLALATVNFLCFYFLFMFENERKVSITTVNALFGVINILYFCAILLYIKCLPASFLCCNKNTSMMATPAIDRMQQLLLERADTFITRLSQFQVESFNRQTKKQPSANSSLASMPQIGNDQSLSSIGYGLPNELMQDPEDSMF